MKYFYQKLYYQKYFYLTCVKMFIFLLSRLLSGFFSQLSFIVDNIEKRKLQWEKVEKLFTEELPKSSLTPLEFLDDERVDKIALSV